MRINGISVAIKVRSKSELAFTQERIYIYASFAMVLTIEGVYAYSMESGMVAVYETMLRQIMVRQVMVLHIVVLHVMLLIMVGVVDTIAWLGRQLVVS
jgi:hypothetical protein